MWILDFFSGFSKRVGSKLLVYHIEWHHQEFPRFVLRLRAEPSTHTTSCNIHGHESHQHKYYPIREISRYRVVLSFYILHLLLYAGCRAPQESFPQQHCSQAKLKSLATPIGHVYLTMRSCFDLAKVIRSCLRRMWRLREAPQLRGWIGDGFETSLLSPFGGIVPERPYRTQSSVKRYATNSES
jgi:hypothetical protein